MKIFQMATILKLMSIIQVTNILSKEDNSILLKLPEVKSHIN